MCRCPFIVLDQPVCSRYQVARAILATFFEKMNYDVPADAKCEVHRSAVILTSLPRKQIETL